MISDDQILKININPVHNLSKKEIFKKALVYKNEGKLYDLHNKSLEDVFNGSIDRFCQIAVRLRYSRRILDIGAGNGILISLLAELGHECYAIDINEPSDKLRKRYKDNNIQFEICNAEIDKIPFPDSFFNAVICCQVLEHFTHSHLGVMKEAYRLLAMGGIVEVDVPNAVCFRNRSRMLRGKNITWDYKEHYLYADPLMYKGYTFYPLRHNREFTRHELYVLLQECDFTNINVNHIKSLRYRPGSLKIKSIGSFLRDLIPSFRKTLLASGVKGVNSISEERSVQVEQKWLILSHAFNMDGRAASQTITDKIPHLLALGIKPIVLSSIAGKKDKFVKHYRIPPITPLSLRFELRHILRQRTQNKLLYHLIMSAVSLLCLPFYITQALLVRLEVQWSWFLSAYFMGIKASKLYKPALIYSTGGANSAHLAGYLLSQHLGLPWIVEVHDPLISDSHGQKKMRKRFAEWIEKLICTHADAVWWFTEEALMRARQRHPELGNRGHCLIPGADKPIMARKPYQKSSKIVIAHFGSLSGTRNIKFFLNGLRQTLDKNPERRDIFRLHMYGGKLDSVSISALRDFPYPEVVQNLGRLEYNPETGESGRERVLKIMNSADCLLLLHGNEPFCEEYIPSKLYEYLWTQRPILALVFRNPQMEQILRAFNHWVVPADDSLSLATTLDELYERWVRNDLTDSGHTSPYTVNAAVKTLSTWANQAIAAHQKKKQPFIVKAGRKSEDY